MGAALPNSRKKIGTPKKKYKRKKNWVKSRVRWKCNESKEIAQEG